MHELPPLIHKERDRMIDVHHTILPLTARPSPDAAGMLADAQLINSNLTVRAEPVEARNRSESRPSTSSGRTETLCVLSPTDMVIHCAAHMIADGDLAGGLRNLWDMHCLLTEFQSTDPDFYLTLAEDAAHHQLTSPMFRAVRLSRQLYGTEVASYSVPARFDFEQVWSDRIFIHRLTARDGWGRPTRKVTRLAFYIRSHWLRMPPLMLARHLWTKWRKG